MSAVAALACCGMLAGCFPMITHGPAVHPGGSGGFTFDLMTGTTLSTKASDRTPPVLLPVPQLFLRQGTARGPFGTPAHLGVQLQPFALVAALSNSVNGISWHEALLGSDLDLYTQLGGNGRDRGVGLLAGIDHLSAYFETGPPLHDGATWYLAHQATYVDLGDRSVVTLASTLARTESGYTGRAAHLGLTLALGADLSDPSASRGIHPFVLLIGSMAIEFFSGPK